MRGGEHLSYFMVVSAKSDKSALAVFFDIVLSQVPVELSQSSYTLIVEGTGTGISFYNQSTINVKRKTKSIFIQTDKAVYKPGQKGTLSTQMFLMLVNSASADC